MTIPVCKLCGEPFVRQGDDGKLRWNICHDCPYRNVFVSNCEERIGKDDSSTKDGGEK